MKKRRAFFAKRAFGMTMALLTLSVSLFGCGKKDQTLVEKAVSSSKDYVFKREEITGFDYKDFSSVLRSGDRIYLKTYVTDDNKFSVISFNSDLSDIKTVEFSESENEYHMCFCYDEEGNTYGVLENFNYDDPGSDGDDLYLVKYDGDGNEVYRSDFKNAKGGDAEDYFNVFSMVYTSEYGPLISTSRGIYKAGSDSGELDLIADFSDSSSHYYGYSVNLVKGEGEHVYSSVYLDEGKEICEFNPADGSFGEPIEALQKKGGLELFDGAGYDIYASVDDGFYGYDAKKGSLNKILDYGDSGIEINYSISGVVAISKDEFLALLPNEFYENRLYRLTKIPADQVKDKKIITLAGNYIDFDIRSEVFKFNESNDEYVIKIVDYSSLITEDDYDAGNTQFNLDIVSGNTPDIMFFSGSESLDSYINKGLFLDLVPYIDKDPELSQDSFVQGPFNAFKTGDKAYRVVPAFSVNTVITKKSYLRGAKSITIQDAKDMIDANGIKYVYAFGIASRPNILDSGLYACAENFVDWENKTCNFNSDGFKEFLSFVKEFPDELSDSVWDDYKDTCYLTGDSLFEIGYLNNFRAYRRFTDVDFGEDVELIGFPNSMNENCSVFLAQNELCVSSKTKYPDACWEFLRRLYSDDFQNKELYQFPMKLSSFDKMAEDSKDKFFEYDSDGNKIYINDTYYIGDQEITPKPLTDEDIQYVKDFIDSVSHTYSLNQNIYNIITEEAAAYFSGQKSVDEVADIIQSRVNIFVNENS